MKLFVALTILALAMAATVESQAASKKTAKKAASVSATKKSAKGAKLSTSMVFDGATVDGRYHSAAGAAVVVESEKNMNFLIGFRKDFKDRLTQEKARLKSGEPVETVE